MSITIQRDVQEVLITIQRDTTIVELQPILKVGSGGGGAVDSVNGKVGVVVLTTTDISEGTNEYYTEAKVSANTSVALNTAKVTFPEAPNDGLQYGRQSEGWTEIEGKNFRLTQSITGATNLDWADDDVIVYTLTGASTLTDINLPQGTNTDIKEFLVTGNFALTLPVAWTPLPNNDAYDGATDNHIIVSCINGNTGSEVIIYSLTNL